MFSNEKYKQKNMYLIFKILLILFSNITLNFIKLFNYFVFSALNSEKQNVKDKEFTDTKDPKFCKFISYITQMQKF